MNKVLSLILFTFCLFLAAEEYTLVIPEDATVAETNAATQFIRFFTEATGGQITRKTEGSPVSSKEKTIYFGQTAFAAKKGIHFESFGKEEWLIKAEGNSLILGGGRPRGTLYASLEFLESFCNIITTSDCNIKYPNQTKFQWITKVEKRGTPAFRYRGIYSYFAENPLPRIYYMINQRQNFFHGEKLRREMSSLGLSQVYGSPGPCHTFYSYTKDWPEEYENCLSMEKNGKRVRSTSGSGPGQICFTNPMTRKLFLKQLCEYIARDRKASPQNYPVIYDLSPNDNYSRCECASCLLGLKRYKNYAGVLLEFINSIASEIAKKFPDIIIQTTAYMHTLEPPENIRAAPNVIVRIAQLGTEWNGIRDTTKSLLHSNNKKALEQLRGWSNIARISIWDYWIMYCGQGEYPYVNTEAIAENMQIYRNLDVFSVFAECEGVHIASFHALRLWIGYRFMNNPDLEINKEIDFFMSAHYGKAGADMRRLHDYIQLRNNKLDLPLGNLPLSKRKDLDADFFQVCEQILEQAEKAASDAPVILSRIAQERVAIDNAHIGLFHTLPKNPMFKREKLIQRFEENAKATYRKEIMTSHKIKQLKEALKFKLDSYNANILPPEQFKDRKILADYTWNTIQRKSRMAQITDDPDAAGKRCIQIKNKPGKMAELRFGVYNPASKKHLKNITIPKEKIPPDEKYHFYPVGNVTLTEKTFFWTHWSWNIQCDLSQLYDRSGLNNNVEIQVSLKVAGPAYVPNSHRKDNFYAIDRVVVLRSQE